jgi:hypothetical protein
MGAQIRFFDKNKADFSNISAIATASQGDTYADNVRDRSNNTAWVTTGSVDADNTTFELDFGEIKRIDSILLLKHNFKSYEIQYWDGAAYQDFATAIDETVFADDNSFHQFTAVETQKVLLTIRGTQIVDDEKKLYQFICTEEIGQFNGWPVIKGAKISRNRTRTKMLSGKENIREQVGAFSCSLSVAVTSDSEDLTIIESLHDANEGFLVWLSGGDEAQFSSVRKGYRLEDVYLMKCASELTNEFYKGIYPNGLVVKFDLVEVVD